jgi:hypothetical protein
VLIFRRNSMILACAVPVSEVPGSSSSRMLGPLG